MDKVIRPFCWNMNCPNELFAPAPVLYTRMNSLKICIKSDFKDIFFKLVNMTEVTRCFCWHQNFVPKGMSAPVPGLSTCIKSWKNGQSDKAFLLKLFPRGCLPLPRGLYTCIKSLKIYIKWDLKRYFLNLQLMTEVTRCSCWHQNFVPKGLSVPALGLYTCTKSWKNVYKIRLQRDILKLVANHRSDKSFLLTSKFCSLGLLSDPYLRLYTFIKSWNDLYKIRGLRDFLKHATNGQSGNAFLLTSKVWPKWVVCPYRGYIHTLRGQIYIFETCNQWSRFHQTIVRKGCLPPCRRLNIQVWNKTKYHIK